MTCLHVASCAHPGVLDSTAAALVQLPPVARWCTVALPSSTAWVFVADSGVIVKCDESPRWSVQRRKRVRAERLCVPPCHCSYIVGAVIDREGGYHNPVIKDVTVGFGPDRLRMNIYCKEAPGSVIFTEPAAENERVLDSLPEADDFGQNPLSENERARALHWAQGQIPAMQKSHSRAGCPAVVHSKFSH